MYNQQYPTFLYTINANKIGEHFIEHSTRGKYNSYVSKNFYGAVIRCRKSLVRLDLQEVVMTVRVKGRSDRRQSVTGVKIDLIEKCDPRIDKYGLDIKELTPVEMQIDNIPGNIMINAQPALLNTFFYKRKDGSTVINFVEK